MPQLSNGYGIVHVDGAIVTGWRGGCLIGDAVLPMTRADALDFLELCLACNPGSGAYRHNSHTDNWLAILTNPPRQKAVCHD